MTQPSPTSARPAAFLDRDGTIIVEKNFLGDPAGIELLPRAVESIILLNKRGYRVIGVTNQSGVARGYYGEEAVQSVNARVVELLQEQGATIDEIFYCPHHPQAELAEYRRACDGRKPNVGMATQAMAKYPIEIEGSLMIGDRAADIQFGKNLGVPAILVLTGYGREERERIEDEHLTPPDHIARDLFAAVEWALGRRS